MIFDGVLGSEAIDSSGEILDIEGADISDVDKGTLLLNWEHQPGEKGASTLVGVVIAAKKIFSAADCDNDRQRMYWDEIKLPFIYGICRLYDGAGHDEAKRIAAIIRDHVANGEMVVCRFSVEGSTLEKEGNRLKVCVIRRVAVTVKPCNRTANTGLIEDPNAPEGFKTKHSVEKVKDLLDITEAHKSELEFEHPMYQRLAGAVSLQCNPLVPESLTKTLAAGSYNAAPGALAGGAALQREDVGPKKAQILAALRDYSQPKFDKAEFRAFAKHRLPEASDSFLDHFTDVAQDYHVKRSQLAKKEEAIKPAPASKVKAAPKAAAAPAPEDDDPAPVKIPNGTIRGVPTKPVAMTGYRFDEQNGVLHTPKGSFPLYNPDKGFAVVQHPSAKKPFYKNGALHVAPGADLAKMPHNGPNPGFREIYSSKPIEDFHSGKVMPNWVRVHDLTKKRQLPEEVIVHSAMFSMMSPNTPVRPHELMYAHMADTFEDLGIDARDPDFKRARKHWLGKDQGTNYPRTSTEYFKTHPDVHLSNDSLLGGRKAGELQSFMLGNNKFENVAQYHKLHSTLADMVQRHGVDARAATAELMALKAKHENWKAKRQIFRTKVKKQAAQELGLKDDLSTYVSTEVKKARASGEMNPKNETAVRRQIVAKAQAAGLKNNLTEHAEAEAKKKFGDYTGTVVPGLAPKTGRFTFSMLGGGNSFVPDTHIIRHLFGMDAGKDSNTLAYLKSVLWNSKSHHILEGMDRWYAKNHPAAKLMQEHPQWGEHFKDDPEQANFPSFWRHWCTIAGDERARGMDASASNNEFSTHEPFWMGIDKFLKKDEVDQYTIGKLLGLHHQYRDDHGEVPAQMMYFAHLVPHLLETGDFRQRHDDPSDFVKSIRPQVLEMQLIKSTQDMKIESLNDPRVPSVHAIYIKRGDKEHRAGRFMLVNNELHHLEDHYGLLGKLLPDGPLDLAKLSTIHGLKMSPHLRIVREEAPAPEANQEPAPPAAAAAPAPEPRPPSVFEYHRAGMDHPHTLEINAGVYLLDGNRLSHPEVQQIASNVSSGAGTIRYKQAQPAQLTAIQKMEAALEDLAKADGGNWLSNLVGRFRKPKPSWAGQSIDQNDPGAALAHIRQAVKAGHIHPDAERALTRHIYEDPSTGLGNKYAYTEFRKQNRPGVHVALDGTDFSAINNAFGHDTGDEAIKAFGSAVRGAAEEAAPGAHKAFRPGGDEMNLWLPSHEHAAKFARALHQRLDAMPPVQGVHKLAMGMGFGSNPQDADKALYQAKEAKYLPGQEHLPARERARAFKVGQAPNMAHSLVPGHEGAIPLHNPQAATLQHVAKMPEPKPASPAAGVGHVSAPAA